MIDIIPGILEKDLKTIEEKVALVSPHVAWIQIDFADNTFVPNVTWLEISKLAPIIEKSGVSFEAHIMTASPEKLIKPLADVGFKRLIAHAEAHDPRLFLDEAEFESVEVGMALDGSSEIDVIEPYLDTLDVLLIMTIEAGFSGQPFLPEAVEKIKIIHHNLPNLPIEVDGGITEKTARIVIEAGATRLVTTHFLFQNPKNIVSSIAILKGGK